MKQKFALSVEADNSTGEVLAVYFQVREGKAAQVREFEGGAVFANYNRRGELLGIELLAPCSLKVFDKIPNKVPKVEREATKRFLQNSIPREMVLASAAC